MPIIILFIDFTTRQNQQNDEVSHFVTHLQDYTAGRMDVARCRFFGVSGMSTSRKFDLNFDDLKKYRPDVVFINLCGNDIRKPTDIDKLVEKLKDIVDELYYNGVSRTSLCRQHHRAWSLPSQSSLVLIRKHSTRYDDQ